MLWEFVWVVVLLQLLCVSFFTIYTIVVNPLRHVLVPKHEIVPEAEHNQLMDSMYIVSKSKFPDESATPQQYKSRATNGNFLLG